MTVANVRGPLDVPGIALLAFGLLALMLGLTQYDVTGATSNLRARLILTAGILALVAFAYVERRAREPVIPPRFFKDGQLALVYGLEILIGMLEGSLFFIPAALVAAEHLTYAAAGAIAAIGAVMFVVVIPGAGRALDAAGSRVVLAGGTTLTALGLAIFAFGFSDVWVAIGVDGRRRHGLRRAARRADALHRHQPRRLEGTLGRRGPALGVFDLRPDPRRLAGRRRRRLAGERRRRLSRRVPVVYRNRDRHRLVTLGLHAKARERAEARS